MVKSIAEQTGVRCHPRGISSGSRFHPASHVRIDLARIFQELSPKAADPQVRKTPPPPG